MRRMRYWVSSSLIVLVVLMSSGRAGAQSGPKRFVSFNEFVARNANAAFDPSKGKVLNGAAFEEMRQHIQKLYEGVQVTHSFVEGSQTFDCMPIDKQPALRMQGLSAIAAAPPAPSAPAGGAAGVNAGAQQNGKAAAPSIVPGGTDNFGNTIGCADKTVPIARTTLEQLSQFPTLADFLHKSPDGKGKAPVPLAPRAGTAAVVIDKPSASSVDKFAAPSPVQHLHDYTYQWVYNLGGNSTLSVNNPYVYTPWGEVFSLSQVWYIGFNGGATQTVEAGWQVFPDRLGDEQPHLFAYYTADGYNRTGCYDYGCGAFVQYSSSLYLGTAFSPVSSPGGAQYEIAVKWEYWYGNWWLSVMGNWVGYYPASLFGSGEMATHSSLIEFGGEIVGGNGTSYNYYPPMGSGYYGTSGWTWAAYQRQIWYFDSAWGTHSPSLGSGNECPASTNMSGPYWGGSDWQTYFFFGGPAGWC
jgi:hypothetical protein